MWVVTASQRRKAISDLKRRPTGKAARERLVLHARSDQIVLVFGEESGGELLRLWIFQLRGDEGGPSLIESNEVCRSWVVLVVAHDQKARG